MRYKNNVGPQVRRRRYALGWSQSDLATKLQLAGLTLAAAAFQKSKHDSPMLTIRHCSISRRC